MMHFLSSKAYRETSPVMLMSRGGVYNSVHETKSACHVQWERLSHVRLYAAQASYVTAIRRAMQTLAAAVLQPNLAHPFSSHATFAGLCRP